MRLCSSSLHCVHFEVSLFIRSGSYEVCLIRWIFMFLSNGVIVLVRKVILIDAYEVIVIEAYLPSVIYDFRANNSH